MTPKQAAQKLRSIGDRLGRSAQAELLKVQSEGLQDAVGRSSGSVSLVELKALARRRGAGVYSVRNPDAAFDPSMINAQSGRFRAGWKKGALYSDSLGVLHAPITNASPEAQYLDGQQHGAMRARPIAYAVTTKAETKLFSRISAVITRIVG